MAPAPLLIILKARCFISRECQNSAIYIPQLAARRRMAIDLAGDKWERPRGIKKQKRRRKKKGGREEEVRIASEREHRGGEEHRGMWTRDHARPHLCWASILRGSVNKIVPYFAPGFAFSSSLFPRRTGIQLPDAALRLMPSPGFQGPEPDLQLSFLFF